MSTSIAPFPSTSTSVQVKITIDPSNIPTFLAALKPAHDFVTTLPEFVSFVLYHNPEVPGEFKFIETWEASVGWILKATEEKAPVRDFIASAAKMATKPKEVELWCPLGSGEWNQL